MPAEEYRQYQVWAAPTYTPTDAVLSAKESGDIFAGVASADLQIAATANVAISDVKANFLTANVSITEREY